MWLRLTRHEFIAAPPRAVPDQTHGQEVADAKGPAGGQHLK
jgi:hypothetical protein